MSKKLKIRGYVTAKMLLEKMQIKIQLISCAKIHLFFCPLIILKTLGWFKKISKISKSVFALLNSDYKALGSKKSCVIFENNCF